MKKLLTVLLISGALLGAGGSVFYAGTAAGDDDDDRRTYAWNDWRDARRMSRDFVPATHPDYQNECSVCHFAYPPGLLPARSWEKLMSGLEDHFGDNAELAPETQKGITEYLVANAAEHANSRRAAKFLRRIARDETPLRISETRYFVRKHDEVPERMVAGNPQVKSFANCAACHRSAEKGVFDDDDVRIPGFERAHF
jgi:mono/diheme cytochrome c family protein